MYTTQDRGLTYTNTLWTVLSCVMWCCNWFRRKTRSEEIAVSTLCNFSVMIEYYLGILCSSSLTAVGASPGLEHAHDRASVSTLIISDVTVIEFTKRFFNCVGQLV